MTQVLHCPYCQGTDIVRHGKSPEGKQRYRCRACPERGRTFLLEYTYAGQSPDVKQQIVDMAICPFRKSYASTFWRRQRRELGHWRIMLGHFSLVIRSSTMPVPLAPHVT